MTRRPSGGANAGHQYAVRSSVRHYQGDIFEVLSDDVAMPGGVTATREYTRHLGAVGVVALDEADRVVLVRQYRHPVGRYLWELPAGLVDLAGEAPQACAVRELAEEADLRAAHWEPLIEIFTSPGHSDEYMRIFLARDLSPVPEPDRHRREHEEAELTVARFDLGRAVDMIFEGEIVNGPCATGLLAARCRRP
ncbi:MAG: NUDIX domain-containing protein [Micromonosporaceae bacterium]